MERVDRYLIKAFESRQQDLRELALDYFGRAATEEPDDAEILIELAKSQVDCGLKLKACDSLETACRMAGDDAELLMDLGRTFRLAGAPELALDAFRRVAKQPKHSAQATLEAVLLLERQHQLEEARELVDSCRSSRNSPQLKLAAGCLEERTGDLGKARKMYRQIWSLKKGDVSIEAGYRLARLLDRSDNPDEAMRILRACKKIEQTHMPAKYLAEFVNRRRDHDRGMVASLPADWFKRDRPGSDAAGRVRSLVVLGHPRSGTSLFAKLFSDRHPVSWVDESPTFDVLGQQLLRQKNPAPEADGLIRMLDSLEHEEIERFEESYRHRMSQGFDQAPLALLDKNPGLSSSLPSLSRLLPGSSWVFLMRDPRDVALSCYFQRLGATPLGYSCLSLKGALEAVLHVQWYWKTLRSHVPDSRALELRYEELVQQPDALVAKVANRFARPMAPPSGSHQGSPAPILLESPTYADIQQPVHLNSTGRWTRHRARFNAKRSGLLDEIVEEWEYDA